MTKQCVRIIGGKWRGRKIHFPKVRGLRPTPDRVRETVFNWLQADIYDANCLDAFAGSGALGLEALSRGAKHVVFLDRSVAALKKLKQTCSEMMIDEGMAKISEANALRWLQRLADQQFDIVFLDPPFCHNLLKPILEALIEGHWLAPAAKLYIEHEIDLLLPGIVPPVFTLLKSQQAGEVGYALLSYQPSTN